LSITRQKARLTTGLPATALAELDFHQLDSFERFHRLTSNPPSPSFAWRDILAIRSWFSLKRRCTPAGGSAADNEDVTTVSDQALTYTDIGLGKIMQRLTSWLMKYRFTILCLSVFGVMCLHTRNGQWVGDFWDHSAAVRELATHILHPKHPQLLLEAPHPFYSPYTVTVALLVRALHSDAVTALSILGLINLGLLFLGLGLFVSSTVPKDRTATAFYTLLLTLFWWGSEAWSSSGFFHIGVLAYVIPYPSTFAVALTLIAVGINRLRIETKRQIALVPIFLIAVTVLISHPITFLFLAAGLLSQSFAEKGCIRIQVMLVGALLSLAFLVAAFWPYFPVLKFFMRESFVYDARNSDMYQHVVQRIWPSLIGVPLVIGMVRSNWRRPLVLMLVILTGIYVFGAISQKYSYGRVVSYIVLLLHITIAEHLCMLESRAHGLHALRWCRQLVVPATVTAMALSLALTPLKSTLAHALLQQPSTYKSYLFLSRFTGQYDVVLSDIDTSWMVPTFGGKVIASRKPLAFIPDQYARRFDLLRFFNGEASLEEREQTIHKYKANHVLINKSKSVDWQDLASFMPQGQLEFESDSFLLFSLKPMPGKNVPPINENHQPGPQRKESAQ
jgi:hypothetical protein